MNFGTRIFFKSAARLFKGAVLAQLISVLSIPVLTRLYSESEFGLYSIFLSCCGVLSTLMVLRLDIAILNVNSLIWQQRALKSILKIGMTTCFVFSFLIVIFYTELKVLLKLPFELLVLTPIAALCLSLFNFYINIFIKINDYSGVNKTRIFRTVKLNIIQISSAQLAYGLIIGELVSRFIAILIMRRRLQIKTLLQNVHVNMFRFVLFFKKYMTYSLLSGVLSTFTMQLPTFFLTFKYGLASAGAYLIAIRLASLPSVFLGQTMSQLLTARIDQIKVRNSFLYKILFINSIASIVIFLLAFLIVKFGGHVILGEAWESSLLFFYILIPLYLSQLIVQPFNNLLNNQNKQQQYALWDFFRLLSVSIWCFYSMTKELSASEFLMGLSFTMSLFYFIMLGLVFKGEMSET